MMYSIINLHNFDDAGSDYAAGALLRRLSPEISSCSEHAADA